MSSDPPLAFDVLLSHNSKDKPAVRELKARLVQYRLTAWLDEDELRPGLPDQPSIEAAIRTSKSVVVAVGASGLGPWEDEEMRAALKLAVKDKRPVIPVLLPGAPKEPELPLFLTNRTWVDLRAGFSDEGIEKIVWGITGKKPERAVQTRPPIASRSHGDLNLVPFELPPAAENFFGRDEPRQKLIDRLKAGKNAAIVGPAGLGKTATAAEALRAAIGTGPESLAASPFSGGVVYLDFYALRGANESAWHTLANKLAGPGFLDRSPARDRATEACRGRRFLLVIEGGEEANGQDGRGTVAEFFGVLSPENRWLLLTRLSTQAAKAETIEVREALDDTDAGRLLDSLTDGALAPTVRERVLGLLEGHPLALTWAGNLLARGDEDPTRLATDWGKEELPSLSHPGQAERTLEWLFARSVRGLDDTTRAALAAAGLLGRDAFPFGAIQAALDCADDAPARAALRSLVQCGFLRRAEVDADHWQFTHVLGYRFARHETGSDPAVRDRLGCWLKSHLESALSASEGGHAAAALARPLRHAIALLRADSDQFLWVPLANFILYEANDRLIDLGRLDVVRLAVEAVEGWLARFPAAKAQESDWQRETSSFLDRQGDVLRAQGDLAGALKAYRESLAVRQRLAAADPSNAGWQRDLSVSLTRLAGILERSGSPAEALPFAERSLEIGERFAALDPTNATWQSDVRVTRELVKRLRGG